MVPSKGALLMTLFASPIAILTLGLGMIVALLNSIVRDTGNLLGALLSFYMYLTPILYAKPDVGILHHLSNINPMYYFIAAGRDMVLTGHLNEPVGFMYSCVFAIIVFFVGIMIFHLTETRITERI
jgi:lipopolysaccharide transport system permease protein